MFHYLHWRFSIFIAFFTFLMEKRQKHSDVGHFIIRKAHEKAIIDLKFVFTICLNFSTCSLVFINVINFGEKLRFYRILQFKYWLNSIISNLFIQKYNYINPDSIFKPIKFRQHLILHKENNYLCSMSGTKKISA